MKKLGLTISAFLMLATILFILAAERGCTIAKYSDQRVTAYSKLGFRNFIAPHSEPQNILKIFGATYENLRGCPPFYIQLSNSHRILFVNEDKNQRSIFHIIDLQTKSELKISGDSYFGTSIGCPSQQDFVQEIGDGQLLIMTKRSTRTDAQVLNLTNKSVSDYFNP